MISGNRSSDWGFKSLLGSEENNNILIELLNRIFPDYHIESLDYLPRDITIPVGKMKEGPKDGLKARPRAGARWQRR